MGPLSGSQRVVPVIAGLVVVIAAAIGFWPVSVAVNGNSSYSCGSGFLHSGHTWKVETQVLALQAQGAIDTSATPSSACPSKVDGQRGLAYLLVVLALVGGVGGAALLSSEPNVRRRTAG